MIQPLANSDQLKKIHAALHRRGLLCRKREMVSGYSSGRTESSREMFQDEAKMMLDELNEDLKNMQKEKDSRQKMVNHIIAMAHEMGWIKRVMKATPTGLKQVNDYQDLHNWVEKYGYLKKSLNRYTYKELPILVTAFQNVYNHWLKKKR
ncbi:MAG: hypothetical protein ACT4OJ_14205 [Bacteroidota bacterium]